MLVSCEIVAIIIIIIITFATDRPSNVVADPARGRIETTQR